MHTESSETTMQQQQEPQGYSALDTPLTGGTAATREPWPLGSFIFSFQNIIRGFPSNMGDNRERCKFVFRCEEVLRARKWARSDDNPNPRDPQEFVGEEYHAWTNFYENPGPRATMHGWISAIIGHEYQPGENFIPRQHVGAEVEVIIGLNDNNKPIILSMTALEDEDAAAPEPEPEPVLPVGRRRSAAKSELQPF